MLLASMLNSFRRRCAFALNAFGYLCTYLYTSGPRLLCKVQGCTLLRSLAMIKLSVTMVRTLLCRSDWKHRIIKRISAQHRQEDGWYISTTCSFIVRTHTAVDVVLTLSDIRMTTHVAENTLSQSLQGCGFPPHGSCTWYKFSALMCTKLRLPQSAVCGTAHRLNLIAAEIDCTQTSWSLLHFPKLEWYTNFKLYFFRSISWPTER